jgi:hypothetical protein
MKKRTNKHGKLAGGRGRGRPALSGNVQIEPVHVSQLDLTKLARALEQYWNCLDSVDRTKLSAK